MDLHVERVGTGPPLLLVHGLGMSHRAWDGVVPRLADRYECFAVDLPGFGASPPLEGPARLDALARACADAMARAGHERFHVAGNSLGGGVALWLALSGTALSACALSPVGFMAGWERAYAHVSLLATRASGHPMRHLTPIVGRSAAVRRVLLLQLAAHGERVSRQVLARGFVELVQAPGYHSALRHAVNWRCPTATPSVPVTVAWGEHDRLLLARRQSARARERLPRARHVPLSGCGHLPAWDDPALVAEVIAGAA